MDEKKRLFIAKIFSRPVTIILVLSAVLSIIFSTHVAAKYDILLVLFTLIIPVSTIIIFKQLGITKDYNVTRREDRPKLFFIMAITFIIATLVAYKTGDETLITAYRVLFSTFFIGFVITLFWKISYHMIWTCISVFVINYIWQNPYLLLLLFILPFIAWSRVYMKRHTLMQVVAGTLLTGLCIFVVLTWL